MKRGDGRAKADKMLHLIFGIPCAYVIARFVLPLALPLWATLGAILLLLAGAEFHLWNRLSSGSVFAPEFPRALILLFNGAFGAVLLLALMQIALDLAALAVLAVRRSPWLIPDGLRIGAGVAAIALAALGVFQA
ncbi:MAG: metallophosphoesterase, partial [Sphingomonadales bacterium]